MSQEARFESIILKKQPLGEADEIVTMYAAEAGKIRGLAKSSKSAKSKLQHGLQSLFLVEVTLAGKGLPKIIGVEIINTFPGIREDLEHAKRALYAVELVLKFTPDEQKNEELFYLLKEFLAFLDAGHSGGRGLEAGFAKFKLAFLDSVGLSVRAAVLAGVSARTGFSNSRGGFLSEDDAADYVPVALQTFRLFEALQKSTFASLPHQAPEAAVPYFQELHHMLSGFIQYQLEREIKSENLLAT